MKMGLILGFLGFLLFDGFLLAMAHNVHRYTFILEEKNFTRLCSTKSMLVVNGMFPGPTIHVRKGDTAFVNAVNKGSYGVTLHWHGVKQPRNPWSDGPENITQCPIKPGHNFTYEVIFSDEEGTIWWHAHSDWTRATVHGAIVVSPTVGESFPFPKPYAEKVIVLALTASILGTTILKGRETSRNIKAPPEAEWYKGSVMEVITTALASGGDPNISDAYTINGFVGSLSNCSSDLTYNLTVTQGKTYLLKVVHAGLNEPHFFGIANHTVTVVGQDGAYMKPFVSSYIMISPGQTMDLLLTANQSPSYYYMAAYPFFDSQVQYDSYTVTAVVKYEGNYTPPSSPAFPDLPEISNETAAFEFEKKFKALATKKYPIHFPKGSVDEKMLITVSINEISCANSSCAGPDGNRISSSLNNISFKITQIDVLQAYVRNISGVYDPTFPDYPPYFYDFTGDVGNNTLHPTVATRAKVFDFNASVEVVFQGTNVIAAETHPIHLHGYSFFLVGSDFGNFNDSSNQTYNLVDPPEINTFSLPRNGWSAIRFYADNPGVWFLHCHLERHLSWGMKTVFIVKNGTTLETSLRPPPPGLPKCS